MEKYGIIVDGISLPGYASLEEAQTKIDNNPVLKSKGAVAAKLIKPQPKKSFSELKKEMRSNLTMNYLKVQR